VTLLTTRHGIALTVARILRLLQQQQPSQQRMVTPMMSQVPVNPMTQQQPVNTMTTQQQFMSGHQQIKVNIGLPHLVQILT
jgi:hypothetical protein